MNQVLQSQMVESESSGENAATMLAITQSAYGTDPEEVLRLTTVARPIFGDAEVLCA